jgi:hypothetical protein
MRKPPTTETITTPKPAITSTLLTGRSGGREFGRATPPIFLSVENRPFFKQFRGPAEPSKYLSHCIYWQIRIQVNSGGKN